MTADFLNAYLDCALWSSINLTADPDSCETFDAEGYTIDDIAPAAHASLREECLDFYQRHVHLWANEANYSDSQAGHDFWLTRNGHGAGFWDRGIANGETLTDAARVYGAVDLYVGDDGRIYV